ncbi:carbamoyltransferase HypF [Ideonella livida]|uniref:acylphosphatase n=1 Tax=Ideonella livida TaxID=2707176 RepID=A0A7C9THQ0_9BURK|nr:Sua5/YciO/YrdC/YwlC family protein [Ideonella livida]NDY89802.1 carbamoyltransferase HypF [Ideonella livida]
MAQDPSTRSPAAALAPAPALSRWAVAVQGAVQGVGFRPWWVRQAAELGLSGWVRNGGQGLRLELQGPEAALHEALRRLRQCPPPLARISAIRQQPLPLDAAAPAGRFEIHASEQGATPGTGLPPDTAPCADCLHELFDPTNRRWRHPFINCTQCGPRFSVTRALPYDRPQTSLAGFALCPACAAEYAHPADRRHHAQPIACPACGPRLALWTPDGRECVEAGDALAAAVACLRAGQVLAIKGAGGYHLVADALQPEPLARLRAAKQRASKPFALMLPTVASAALWVQAGLGLPAGAVREQAAAEVLATLTSPARPVLLLPCQPGVAAAHPGVAPGLAEWGVMLPATPLHELLVHEALGRPAGTAWRQQPQPGLLWVMTSANPGGEPLVTREAEALSRLAALQADGRPLVDALLVNDREILGRLDDSVRRPMVAVSTPPTGPATGPATGGGPSRGMEAAAPTVRFPFVRRARGYVPDPIPLPAWAAEAPPVLATGGWLKATVCLTRGAEAFFSPHVGDLGSVASRQALVESAERLCQFLAVRPAAVAHDLHPDFFSTQHAQALAAGWGVPAVPVQHHAAHAAAVLAEHGHAGPALALVLDGTGLGDDGQVWGGELLALAPGAAAPVRRLAHLPPLPLPGGDKAATEPWRLAAGLLAQAGRGAELVQRWPTVPGAGALASWLQRQASTWGPAGQGGAVASVAATRSALAAARCTSAGRWFDAAAALIGGLSHQNHEAEAAMRLEAWATQAGGLAVPPWPGAWQVDAAGTLHWPGLVARLLDAAPEVAPGVPSGGAAAEVPAPQAQAAAAFHHTLVQALAAWVQHHACAQGVGTVALGGGCFINRLLSQGLVARLQAAGLLVLHAQAAPPGDGGLSLGQVQMAAWRLAARP